MLLKVSTGFLFICLIIVFTTNSISAQESSFDLTTRLDANDIKTIRLKNLPQSGYLSATIKSNKKINIRLIDETNMKLDSNNRTALFSSKDIRNLNFKILIPHSSHYYLLLDNKKGDEERQVDITVAAGISDKKRTTLGTNYQIRVNKELQKIEQNLRRYFIFEDLTISIRKCGTANAFSNDNTIIICQEIGRRLLRQMNDKDKARDALLFAIMHEVGHVLLNQWGYPFYDNEEVADEFATAILVMFNQGERAKTQAEFFNQLSADKEIELKRDRNDRHPISVQRARNILKWLKDKELVKRWQNVFVPRFQTSILKKMALSDKAWVNHKLVEKELTHREELNQ